MQMPNMDNVDSMLGNNIFKAKIATLIVGVINIGFISHSYIHGYANEEAYLSAVIICFIISFLWAMAIIVGLLSSGNDLLRKADMLFHMVACVFYLVTLIVFFVSVVKHGSLYKSRPLWEAWISLILGAVNTILYGFCGYLLFQT